MFERLENINDKETRMINCLKLAGIALLSAMTMPALADAFPSKPVTIVVPFSAGGGVDVLVRSLGAALSARWKQPLIIDNRTGAGSLIGSAAVAQAKPDGYTLLATTSQTFTANRYLYKSLPYDPDKSFVPITMLVKADQFLIANKDLPVSSLGDLVKLAKSSGGGLSYGSWGSGSEPQITYEQLNMHEHLRLTHVPYKGVAPVLQAVVAGEVAVSVGSAAVASQLIDAGKIKALAIASNTRSARYPDVPTTAELGYPYLTAEILIGLFAPSGTPGTVVDRISGDVRSLMADEDFAKAQVRSRGFEVLASRSDEVDEMLKKETSRIGEVVQAASIKPE